MPDLAHYEKLINARLAELDTRLDVIDHELAEPKDADLGEQAIDIEDDEVLEGLGHAAQKEVALLKRALARIEEGSYGLCLKCAAPISDARLEAVIYAPLCTSCAQGAGRRN